MKAKFLLVVSFLLIVSNLALGFTVVLKSGKKIEGAWLDEDRDTIRLKDEKGTILVFRKSTLDFEAMRAASRMQTSAAQQTQRNTNNSTQQTTAEQTPQHTN